MSILTILRGLPGSGKSTFAAGQLKQDGNTIRVNRDSLRVMLHGNLRVMLHGDLKWTGAREKITVAVEIAIVERVLYAGKNVIVDDTNLLGNDVSAWMDWCREWNIIADNSIKCIVHDFTDVSLAECIRRDGCRTDNTRVGRGVIDRMALKAGLIDLSNPEKVVAIVDIDGTLANFNHRLYFIEQVPKDYDSFYGCVLDDNPIWSIWNAVDKLKTAGWIVIVLSGRPTCVGWETNEWLCRNVDATRHMPFAINPDYLFMRNAGDHRPDNEVKRELMDMMFAAGLKKDAIKIVLDDRDSVCAVWREMDLPLVQVSNGSAINVHPNALRLMCDIGIPIAS